MKKQSTNKDVEGVVQEMELDNVDKIIYSYGWAIDGWGRLYYAGFEHLLGKQEAL